MSFVWAEIRMEEGGLAVQLFSWDQTHALRGSFPKQLSVVLAEILENPAAQEALARSEELSPQTSTDEFSPVETRALEDLRRSSR